MKKNALLSVLLMAGVLLLGVRTASAVEITFDPTSIDTTGLAIGSSLSVDVNISGLEAGGLDEIVSAFDFDVLFDQSVVDATAVTFNTASLFPVFGFGLTSFTDGAGSINATSLAFEDDATLMLLQGDSFTLFTIDFDVVAADMTSALSFDLSGGGVVGKGAAFLAVPEPVSLALMGLGLVGVGFSRRRKALAA